MEGLHQPHRGRAIGARIAREFTHIATPFTAAGRRALAACVVALGVASVAELPASATPPGGPPATPPVTPPASPPAPPPPPTDPPTPPDAPSIPTLHEEVLLQPGSERIEPWFGRSVAVAGTAVVAASPNDGDGGTANGVAHVFGDSKRGWRRVQRLQSANPAWEDRFAQALAADRSRLVVGRDQADEGASDAGAVTVFRRSGYHFKREAEIVSSDAGNNDGFGCAVAISGTTILIGASRDDEGALIDAGSATIWQWRDNAWELQAKLIPPDAASADWFGSAVAIDAGVAAIGAYGDDDRGEKCGAVFTYRLEDGAWILDQKLVPNDLAAGDWFGFSLALSGDLLAVGAPRDDVGGESNGSVRIFRRARTGWVHETTLRPAVGSVTSWFGYALAADGARLLIGIPGDDRGGESSGVAALFERIGGQWLQRAFLAANSPVADELFGSSVAVRGDFAAVGRLVTEDGELSSGRAWVFRLGGTPRSATPPTDRASDGTKDAAGKRSGQGHSSD
jgi:hypothetical protein